MVGPHVYLCSRPHIELIDLVCHIEDSELVHLDDQGIPYEHDALLRYLTTKERPLRLISFSMAVALVADS